MGSYQITRVRKDPHIYYQPDRHQHIVAAEINDQPRSIAELADLIKRGTDDFYTLSLSTGKQSAVNVSRCCDGAKTLRSDIDSEPDNNVNNLPEF